MNKNIKFLIVGVVAVTLGFVLTYFIGMQFATKPPKESEVSRLEREVGLEEVNYRFTSFLQNFHEVQLTVKKISLYSTQLDDWGVNDKERYLKEVVEKKLELKRLNEKLGISFLDKYRLPEDLFYTFLKTDNAYVTQTPRDHDARNGFLATDVATSGQAIRVLVPDYLNTEREYTTLYEDFPATTGHTITLTSGNIRFLIGHVVTDRQIERVKTGDSIGNVGCTEGVTTGCHVHIEFYVRPDEGSPWMISKYQISGSNRHEEIKERTKPTAAIYTDNNNGVKYETTTVSNEIKVYMTHYNLGVVAQNDSSPCTGASGKDLCKLRKAGVNIIALTSDQRRIMSIKFGDHVLVSGEGFQEYAQVEDEMGARFRNGCIKKQGYCIKADWACFTSGDVCNSGPVTITKQS